MTTGNVEEMGRKVPNSLQQKKEYVSTNFWKDTVAKVGTSYDSNRQKFLNNKVLIAQLCSDPQCANTAFKAAREKYSKEMRRLPQKDLIVLDNLAQFMKDLVEITATSTDPQAIQTEKKAVKQTLEEYQVARIARPTLEKSPGPFMGEQIELELMKGKAEVNPVEPQGKISIVEKVFKDLSSKLWGRPKAEVKAKPDTAKEKIRVLTDSIKALYANAEWQPLQVEAMKKAYKDLAEIVKIAPQSKDELKNLWNTLAEIYFKAFKVKQATVIGIMGSPEYKAAAKIFIK